MNAWEFITLNLTIKTQNHLKPFVSPSAIPFPMSSSVFGGSPHSEFVGYHFSTCKINLLC